MSKRDIVTDGITRKDFLNGLAATAALAAFPADAKSEPGPPAPGNPDGTTLTPFQARGITQEDPRYYPPALTGMRGSHPGSYPSGHALRDNIPLGGGELVETGESYDLIVVGAGISGLSAAHFFRKRRPNARILILDNHDDFGGHAKRNEFKGSGGNLLLGYGGTQNLEGVSNYSEIAMGLLNDIGVKPKRFYDYYDQSFRSRNGLASAVFFDKETFGRDLLLPNPAASNQGWPTRTALDSARFAAFIAQAPIAEQARRDLLRLQTGSGRDPLPGLTAEEKAHHLKHTGYAEFLLNTVKVHPDVVKYFQKLTHGGYGMGVDAVDVMTGARMSAPGLRKDLGLDKPGGGAGVMGEPYIFHFPDGNASIARLLVRSLVPGAADGSSMEDIVTARMRYPALDREQNVRIRLSSTVVSARNVVAGTEITYMRAGKAYRVRAKQTILACWHMIIPYLCPELPEKQKAAMHACVKIPIVYGTVQIRDWRALKAQGVGYTYCPGSYFSEVMMDFPVSIGAYHYTSSPDQSCVLHLVRTPCAPGLPARDQHRVGRAELYATSFAEFEGHVHDQLDRMFGRGGFKSTRDVQALTINRWPHGYTYLTMPLWDGDVPEDQQIHVVARERFGNIAIANTDAGGDAETNLAIEQAFRAVGELTG